MFHEALERVSGKRKIVPQLNIEGVLPRGHLPGSGNLNLETDPIAALYGTIQKLLYGRAEGLVLHVTSATHGEGVSTIARALADRACTAGHRGVLLLKGFAEDNSPATVHDSLVNCVSRDEPIESVTIVPNGSALAVGNLLGPVGSSAPDPKTLHLAYAECRKKFELIIVDCSPTSSGTYFELIPSAADGIILVIRAESTRPIVIQHCKEMIDQRGGVILSVVLNRVRRYIPKIIYKFI